MNPVKTILSQEMRLAWRCKGARLNLLVFFAAIVLVFPFGGEPDTERLYSFAPAILMMCAMVASIIAQRHFFEEDFKDGTLEQCRIQPIAFEVVMVSKLLSHWLTMGGSLTILTPLLAIALHVPVDMLVIYMVVMALSTFILTCITMLAASLTLGSRQGSVIGGVVVLPLSIPLLIFSASAMSAGDYTLLWGLVGIALLWLPLSVWMSMIAVSIVIDES